MKLMKRLAFGAILIFQSLFIVNCASKTVDINSCLPPVVYLQPISEPTLAGPTNKALAEWAIELRAALRLANSDKAQLRDWAKGQEK
jgi:hypothetical protein